MSALLFAVSLPYLRAHAGRILLTLLGVIIGVQGMVAMGALNHSIIKSFEAGLEAIAGSARLQIAGPETGIPTELAEDALRVPGVGSAVAVIDGSLTLADDPSLRVRTFGIDLLGMVGTRSPQFPREHVHIKDELAFVNALDSIALGQPLLDQLKLRVGDTIRLATPSGIRPYVIRGSLDNVGPTKLFGGLVALLDLPVAEQVFLSPGLTQTIYINAKPDTDVDTLETRLRSAIGARARVERTEARGQQMDALLGSVRVALSLASLVTMIAAFFIIYETIAISVEQRRREIAIARSLGFTRGAVAGVFMLESLILGLLGAAGGVVGGYVLARLSLTTAVAGVSGMYFSVGPGEISLPLSNTAVAMATGALVCLVAGVLPALAAATEPPALVLKGTLGARASTKVGSPAILGAATICAAIATLTSDPHFSNANAKTAWIMLGHALLLFGVALLAANHVRALTRALRPMSEIDSVSVTLAYDFFARRPKRIAACASAIMVGFALVVVLGSVVRSIEGTLQTWLATTFGSDISIGTSPGLNSALFTSKLIEPLYTTPGVRSVQRHRKAVLVFEGKPIIIVAHDHNNDPRSNSLMVVTSRPDAYEKVDAGQGIFASESFAYRYQRSIGDSLALETAAGTHDFEIVGIIRDYTMDLGTVLIAYEVYERLWNDDKLTYAHVWTEPGADMERIHADINRIASQNPSITVVTNAAFRTDVEGRVRRLLAVLGSLQIFACAIAMFGVVNFLLAAVLDRQREIAILRSVGLTRGQIRNATMVEGGLIGFAGATLGLVAGVPGAYFMVAYSMPVAMGWSLDFRFPLVLAITTVIAITLAAALASYFPARRITRGTILSGLQME